MVKGVFTAAPSQRCFGETMNDKKIELTLGLVNAVMQYLGTRPYAEVADMIQAIREQAIPQVPMPEAKAEEAAE